MALSETSRVKDELIYGTPSGRNRNWNWHPDIPIPLSPLFSFPIKPGAIIKWFARAWLPVTELTCYLLLAIVVCFWIQPPLSETTTLSIDWIGRIWLRNIVMMAAIAGFLHYWLHVAQKQGGDFRYMKSIPTATKSIFLWSNQVKDNMFWTLGSGVTLWTVYESGLWYGYANASLPTVSFTENPIWFVLWFLLIGVWYSLHFYCVHRFLHWKPMYDHFHSVHHRNVTTGPWSGFSMHPVEHLLYLSSLLIHLVVPSHPIHMLFHAYWLTLATATSHSGYEVLLLGKNRKTVIATFFHQLHHRYLNCNYGNMELPMDRWFGSFNDGSTAETKRLFRRHRSATRNKISDDI